MEDDWQRRDRVAKEIWTVSHERPLILRLSPVSQPPVVADSLLCVYDQGIETHRLELGSCSQAVVSGTNYRGSA